MQNDEWEEFLRLKAIVEEGLPNLIEQEAAYARLKNLAGRVAPSFLLSDEISAFDEMMAERREAEKVRFSLGGNIGKAQLVKIVEALNPANGQIQTMSSVEIGAYSYLLARYSGGSKNQINKALVELEQGHTESKVVDEILQSVKRDTFYLP